MFTKLPAEGGGGVWCCGGWPVVCLIHWPHLPTGCGRSHPRQATCLMHKHVTDAKHTPTLCSQLYSIGNESNEMFFSSWTKCVICSCDVSCGCAGLARLSPSGLLPGPAPPPRPRPCHLDRLKLVACVWISSPQTGSLCLHQLSSNW